MKTKLLCLKELASIPHFWVDEDNWYSCPKALSGCANDNSGTFW